MKINYTLIFVGTLAIVGMYNLGGWIESLEARDRYRHCQTLNADAVTTDQQAHDMDLHCANKAGYSLKGE